MPVPPQKANIHIDSCAFDPKYYPEDKSAEEIWRFYEKWKDTGIILEIAHSVLKEIEHPGTPLWVKERAHKIGYTIPNDFTDEEKNLLHDVKKILAGNGKIENICQDARHIFEAHKHGHYFVTTDERILKKKGELHKICSCSLSIVKPSELLALIETYEKKIKKPITNQSSRPSSPLLRVAGSSGG